MSPEDLLSFKELVSQHNLYSPIVCMSRVSQKNKTGLLRHDIHQRETPAVWKSKSVESWSVQSEIRAGVWYAHFSRLTQHHKAPAFQPEAARFILTVKPRDLTLGRYMCTCRRVCERGIITTFSGKVANGFGSGFSSACSLHHNSLSLLPSSLV